MPRKRRTSTGTRQRTVFVEAAAGCGKTTALASSYLDFLTAGIPAERAIAITFTRKAAAELKERVSLALLAALPQTAPAARAALGASWSLLSRAVPSDERCVRDALAALPEAPIGTTDAFVQQLLTEFALDAALPLPDGGSAPLDLPISARFGVQNALTRAARSLLDPPSGPLDPDIVLLSRYMPLDRLLAEIARRTDLDDLPTLSAHDLFDSVARMAALALRALDLEVIFEVPHAADEPLWRGILERHTLPVSQWAVPDVARWLAAGASPEHAPAALCAWLMGCKTTGRRHEIRRSLESIKRSLGPVELSLWQILRTLRPPYDVPSNVTLADTLRAARSRLRLRALSVGLRAATLSGELGYEELLDAAIALCTDPPERLRTRYQALLVDELQDADPRQLRLYRALLSGGMLRGYFVGDSRQSIYQFRGAEPDGIRTLKDASDVEGRHIVLDINRRSAPRLVAAHRGLFGALATQMKRIGLRPLDTLDAIEADPDNQTLALEPALHIPDAPVWIVRTPQLLDRDLDECALAAFVHRLASARAEPGRERDTAAVLAPNWATAAAAAQKIRSWAGRFDAAALEESTRWPSGRVADDLRLLLRALLDRRDDAAWLGVWKHPSVGLTDAALARIVAGVGVEAAWDRRREMRLGELVDAERLVHPHEEADQFAFARARAPLREAMRGIGRRSTSQLLDDLTGQLQWRAVLGAGPGGDLDLAELEVLLDWIREQDTEGLSASALLLSFDEDKTEKPQVHLARPPEQIVCTTIFQAKGLAWDHVVVLRPGQHARRDPARDHDDSWVALDGRKVHIEGLTFDPRGGLSPSRDPLGRLSARIHAIGHAEESARMLYVAITRARRSVTLALPAKARRRRRDEEERLWDLLTLAWATEPLPGVAHINPIPTPPTHPMPTGWSRPTGQSMPAVAPAKRQWEEIAPSRIVYPLDRSTARDWSARVRRANGFHLGSGSLIALPDARRGSDSTPVGPDEWGIIAHSWFAAWHFRGPPQQAAIEGHLRAEWGAAPGSVVNWLHAISTRMVAVGGPLWALVTDSASELCFELPLIGAVHTREGEALVSGRMDLWLRDQHEHTIIIDFKAGTSNPTSWDDLGSDQVLDMYAAQLETYADVLRRTGRSVDLVALWFVRTGTSVRWAP